MPRWMLAGVAVLVPASLLAKASGNEVVVFVLAAAAVVPLAGLLGAGTEELSLHAGPRIGGLLNATFGNAAELIIGLLLVARGEVEVVRASITGSILGNLLLVLGAAFLAGGVGREHLAFSSRAASALAASMALAVAGVLMPSIYAHTEHVTAFRLESVSVAVAVVLAAVYAASLVFSLVTHTDALRSAGAHPEEGPPSWSRRAALAVLAAAGLLVGLESELLVGALEPTVESVGVSKLWVGLILVPIVGNAAEHSTAVLMAMKGKGDVALEIAMGSSAQIALLVTPILVFAGLLFGHQLTLVFSTFELGAIALAVAVVALLCLDGRSDWLEGTQLLGLYAILAVTSFYLGKA